VGEFLDRPSKALAACWTSFRKPDIARTWLTSLLACSVSHDAIVARRAGPIDVKPLGQVLDEVNITLAPIDVNLPAFLAPFDLYLVRHDRLSLPR